MALHNLVVVLKSNDSVNASTVCLESKVMRVISSTNDLVKACNIFKSMQHIQDSERYWKDTLPKIQKISSDKIQKDTSRKILLQKNCSHVSDMKYLKM